MANRTKIRFALNPEDEQGFDVENLWAEPLGNGQFRILNSPFFVFGVSTEDIVNAVPDGGAHRFDKIVSRGRHSTYRTFLQNDHTIRDDEFQRLGRAVSKLGCRFENANDRMVAVDIPPIVNISEVYRLLKEGEERGIWALEEGDYAGT